MNDKVTLLKEERIISCDSYKADRQVGRSLTLYEIVLLQAYELFALSGRHLGVIHGVRQELRNERDVRIHS